MMLFASGCESLPVNKCGAAITISEEERAAGSIITLRQIDRHNQEWKECINKNQ